MTKIYKMEFSDQVKSSILIENPYGVNNFQSIQVNPSIFSHNNELKTIDQGETPEFTFDT